MLGSSQASHHHQTSFAHWRIGWCEIGYYLSLLGIFISLRFWTSTSPASCLPDLARQFFCCLLLLYIELSLFLNLAVISCLATCKTFENGIEKKSVHVRLYQQEVCIYVQHSRYHKTQFSISNQKENDYFDWNLILPHIFLQNF